MCQQWFVTWRFQWKHKNNVLKGILFILCALCLGKKPWGIVVDCSGVRIRECKLWQAFIQSLGDVDGTLSVFCMRRKDSIVIVATSCIGALTWHRICKPCGLWIRSIMIVSAHGDTGVISVNSAWRCVPLHNALKRNNVLKGVGHSSNNALARNIFSFQICA